MKNRLFTIAVVLIFIIGLSVLLYPAISEFFNARNQSRAVSAYHEEVAQMDDSEITRHFQQARAYNDRLVTNRRRFLPFTDREYAEYISMLNISSGGVIGTLEIDLIGVNLPIFHGTNENVLQIGIGHMEGTSLPIGGSETHAVITGHRGLPSSVLLTNLDQMVVGDTFVLRILNETFTYWVDQILTMVEPDDFNALAIIPGMDYVTLVTCTPYGVNSHRLLVRGYRIRNLDEGVTVRPVLRPEVREIENVQILLVIMVPSMVILFAVQFVRFLRKK